MKRLLQNLSLFFVVSIVCFFILEMAVRQFSPIPQFGPYFDLKSYQKTKIEPHLPGVSSPGWNTTNRWGMRGEDPPAEWDEAFTVFTVGGSTTICFYLDDQKTWPHLLQENLRKKRPKTWVGNLGINGHSTWGHVLLVDKVFPKIRPDCCLFLIGINDLLIAISKEYQKNRYDKLFVYKTDEKRLSYRIYKHSRLLQIAYLWRRIIFDDLYMIPNAYHTDGTELGKIKGADYKEIAVKSTLEYLPYYRKNIITLIEKCRKFKVKPVFLTQPSPFGEGDYWSSLAANNAVFAGKTYRISAATQWEILEMFNRELVRICREYSVDCVDLAGGIPHGFDSYYDFTHFNDKGAESVAQKIAEYLIPRLNSLEQM